MAKRTRIDLAFPPTTKHYHDFVCDPEGRVGLRASSETFVEVLDLHKGVSRGVIETVFSFGGQRLAIADDTEHFLAGSWGNHRGGGVACYSTRSGELLWHNRTLGRPQLLNYVSSTDCWYVTRDRGGSAFVDRHTGRVLSAVRGSYRKLLGLDTLGHCLINAPDRIDIIDSRSGQVVGRITPPTVYEHVQPDDPQCLRRTHSLRPSEQPPAVSRAQLWKSVGVLSSAVAGDRLIIGLVGGSLSCLSIDDGRVLWELEEHEATHFLWCGVCESRGVVWAPWHIQHGSTRIVELWEIRLDDGALLARHPWIGRLDGAVCRDGTHWASGEFVLRLPGEVLFRFE
jgi:outer membrane protein assembly factor BamB